MKNISKALVLSPLLLVSVVSQSGTKPNIIVILADDMGFADLGFAGGTDVSTPNIDALALKGVRFTQAYDAASISSPSRAGLMTGRYQERWGHDGNECQELPLEEKTMGDRMRELGYTTGMIGKWHLGDTPELLPPSRGFDEVYHPYGNAIYFGAKVLDTRFSNQFIPAKDKSLYTTDLNTERAVEFITQHKNDPFFLYLAFNNVHNPLVVPQNYIDKVKSATKNEDRKKMLAMILALDDAVGKVMNTLKENKLDKNTLVIFLNDNGSYEKFIKSGQCESTPLKGGKSTLYEGGIRTHMIFHWPKVFQKPFVYEQPVISLDILPTVIAASGNQVKNEWKLDCVNLLPYLKTKSTDVPHDYLYWRMIQKSAVRQGDWKVLNPSSQKPELYNLKNDISEKNDLASKYPEIVNNMVAKWKLWNAGLARPRLECLSNNKSSEE